MGFETPCHVWTGLLNAGARGGRYGVVHHGGRVMAAHRAAWIRKFGAVPDGAQLHHLCAVTQCVNPDHLVPLTHGQHIRADRAKLNPELVRYIRRSRKKGNTVARELGVSESLVYQVRARTIWADVE